MGKTRQSRFFMADFETTVYEGQTKTEVWAAASVELFTDDVRIFHGIDELLTYYKSLHCNVISYFHNLKFDGDFWISYLLYQLKFKQAYLVESQDPFKVKWIADKDMLNSSFKYVISDKGQWYGVTIKYNDCIIELRDSLKLLPFSVKRIGQSFGTKHKKLEMEYNGFRYSGCEITELEKEYIKNDVLVVKEALEIMFKEGHDGLTIGSCCLKEYKRIMGREDYKILFPNLYDIPLDKCCYGSDNVGEYIRKSYRGGWCYLVKGKENRVYHNGNTHDVNSLYPSMMSSESGNKFPTGLPKFWKGNIPEEAISENKYYFVRIKTRFYIKKDKLPFIQIKNSLLYRGTEMLDTSDIFDAANGEYFSYLEGRPVTVTLTLTMTDYQLLKDQYELVDFEVLDGCWFYAQTGIFDSYIEKYKKIKMESKGAKRELAKLFLNNLYGKMASSTDSSFKVAEDKGDGTFRFVYVKEHEKVPGYIPVGSAITSYARNFTIRAAQMNYYGVDKPGFIYADTDSIHCDLSYDKIKGIEIHNKNFCCWNPESGWDEAIFVRQKTYIEHVVEEEKEKIDTPYYSIKCAGMPDKCKQLFIKSMENVSRETLEGMSEEEIEFISKRRTLEDFKIGISIPGKLRPKRMPGGLILVETSYKMK